MAENRKQLDSWENEQLTTAAQPGVDRARWNQSLHRSCSPQLPLRPFPCIPLAAGTTESTPLLSTACLPVRFNSCRTLSVEHVYTPHVSEGVQFHSSSTENTNYKVTFVQQYMVHKCGSLSTTQKYKRINLVWFF